jgi:hypothetical protein
LVELSVTASRTVVEFRIEAAPTEGAAFGGSTTIASITG